MFQKDKNIIAMAIITAWLIFSVSGTGCTSKSTGDSSVLQQIGGATDNNNVQTYTQPAQNIAQGKTYFADKEYDKAISAFQKVLVTNPNQEEMSIAYAGIGWSKVKKSGVITDGKNDFLSAYAARSTVKDPKVGLAAVYLTEDAAKIKEAITLLESMGISDTGDVTLVNANFRYSSEIGTGITNAAVHALLATLYYYNNQDAMAKQQISICKQEDPTNDKVTSIDTAITTLGY